MPMKINGSPLIDPNQSQREKVKEITAQLEKGIKELFEADNFKKYLRVMSKFHTYSWNNSLLISTQFPTATYIAGYKAWTRDFNRHVRQNEKGIKILAPAPYKVDKEVEVLDPKTQNPVLGRDGKPLTEKVQVTIPSYKIITVFDVSQTDGEPLPEIVRELTNSFEEYSRIMDALKEISPVPIVFKQIDSGANGYYHLADKKIYIRDDMSEAQTIKTCIHEIAHAILHDNDTGVLKDKSLDRNTKEVEAESIAYTVCNYLGLDTSDYSFGYIGTWSKEKELEELKKSMSIIRSTSSNIINALDKHRGLSKDKFLDKKGRNTLDHVQSYDERKKAHTRHR